MLILNQELWKVNFLTYIRFIKVWYFQLSTISKPITKKFNLEYLHLLIADAKLLIKKVIIFEDSKR